MGILKNFGDSLIARALARGPDEQIGGAADPYMNRWILFPRNRLFNIYLHQFIRDDDPRALHDHPWASLSLMLRGSLTEYIMTGRRGGEILATKREIRAGQWLYRSAAFAHRLTLPYRARGKTWTLFIIGPRVRAWGFHCPQGWRRWQDFCAGVRGEVIGRGCGE